MKIPPEMEQRIKKDLWTFEAQTLSPGAFQTKNATRRVFEADNLRPAFVRDADRILHSFSFSRYFDKTQVFFWVKSDIHSHRMLHVQLVSKLARYVARILRLNEDLVEAIALGHDIGHCPFGHDGEMVLRELCIKNSIGQLWHNYESVWFLQEVEMQNLTLPVLDGILCHNGESHCRISTPDREHLSWEQLDRDMMGLLNGTNKDPKPKSLESSLVRFVDTISYISRDVLDAENLKMLSFNDIPEVVKDVLGKTNRDIINTLVLDLIATSYGQEFIGYSEPVFSALQELYKFNYKHIYSVDKKSARMPVIREGFGRIWDYYLDCMNKSHTNSRIYLDHLELNIKQIRQRLPQIQNLSQYPYAKLDPRIIVRDYLAGMTDQYFFMVAQELDPSIKFQYDEIY